MSRFNYLFKTFYSELVINHIINGAFELKDFRCISLLCGVYKILANV